MTNVNEGHRSRMRKRMLSEGTQNFQEHEVLEVMLYPYIPRKDTNKMAHELLNKFGGFAGVLDATPQQLMMVKGISVVTACNIALLKEVFQRYQLSAKQRAPLKNISDIIKYSQDIMSRAYEEKLVVTYLDTNNNMLLSEEFSSRSVYRVDVNVKQIVASALTAGASGVMLFHCHVDGVCQPSEDDKRFTKRIFYALANINIVLLEHIIFNNSGQYYSFFKEKELERLTLEYNKLNQK